MLNVSLSTATIFPHPALRATLSRTRKFVFFLFLGAGEGNSIPSPAAVFAAGEGGA
jgi:hypothetical protein